MKWIKTHLKLIGVLIAGLALALVGQQQLSKRQARRAASLRADNASDEVIVAEMRRTVLQEAGEAARLNKLAREATEAAQEASNKLVMTLATDVPDLDEEDVLRWVNRE